MNKAEEFIREDLRRMFLSIAINIHLGAVTRKGALNALDIYGLSEEYLAWERDDWRA